MQSLKAVLHCLVEEGSLDQNEVVIIASRLREGQAPDKVADQIANINVAIGSSDSIEVAVAGIRGTLSELRVNGNGQAIQAVVVESLPGENHSVHYRDVTSVFRVL